MWNGPVGSLAHSKRMVRQSGTSDPLKPMSYWNSRGAPAVADEVPREGPLCPRERTFVDAALNAFSGSTPDGIAPQALIGSQWKEAHEDRSARRHKRHRRAARGQTGGEQARRDGSLPRSRYG